MTELFKIIISLIPVFLFLTALIFLDSFKLVKPRALIQVISSGAVAAIFCYFFAGWIIKTGEIDPRLYSKFIAPPIEEFAKGAILIYLIKSKKTGFLVDSAIFGFAAGAGFSVIENIYYLNTLQSSNILLWIIRGLGTAIMHGATTSIFAITSKILAERYNHEKFIIFIPGFLAAAAIHSLFNQFILPPLVTTLLQIIILPLLMGIVFEQSEKMLRYWLETGLENDTLLLESITSGNISETRAGKYLYSLKSKFSGEILADMLCLLRLHLELAIRAKGILLMRQSGFKIPEDGEIREKFQELQYLDNSIGKTGKLALAPILHTSTRDLWQIYFLEK